MRKQGGGAVVTISSGVSSRHPPHPAGRRHQRQLSAGSTPPPGRYLPQTTS
ncbi:MAG: hypothetical protein LUP97_05840 [Methanoregula sp.]|nr:hypothetical protein [Methanoregula sp.]